MTAWPYRPTPPCATDAAAQSALETCEAWIGRHTDHVGRCAGGDKCTCGRTAVLHEARAVLASSIEATGGGSDTSTSKPQSHARLETVAQSRQRDRKDFAIEFGGYLANTADNFMYFLVEHQIEVDQDQWRAMGSAIYEFRKRASLAASIEPQVSVAHANAPCGPEEVKPTPSNDGVTELPSEEWRPIETAPKNGKLILLASHAATWVGSWRRGDLSERQSDEIAWRAYCCGRWADPTHWQPLPSAPSEATR